jgi:hypothetical protein
MADNDIIGQVEAEETDLATHTKLCHMRYLQIINKFDSVDAKFDKIEALVLEVKEAVSSSKSNTRKDYLTVSVYAIGILLSVVGYLLAKFVI